MICDKVTYKNKTEAREAIEGIAQEDGVSMRQYVCSNCGGVHLTTAGRKRIPEINKVGGKKFKYVQLEPVRYFKRKKKKTKR